MLFPMPMRADVLAWILVHKRGGSRKSDRQHVVPSIAIHVVHPSKKMIGITRHRLRLGRVQFVGLLEIRAGVPVWPVNHIRMLVSVKVSNRCSFAVIDWRQFSPIKLVNDSA